MINFDAEYINDNIFLYDSYSNDFPEASEGTLIAQIEPTGALEKELDTIRGAKGWMPLFDGSKECDTDGWYNFYVEVNKDGFDSLFGEVECGIENDFNQYDIEVDKETKRFLHKRIKELFEEKKNWELIFEED